MLGLFCNGYVISNCRPRIQNVSFFIHPCVYLVIYFLVKWCHMTLKRLRPLPSWQPLLVCIHYAFFLVTATITTALFYIMHKQAHHWLTCLPLGSSGTGTVHSSMHLSSWSMHYALNLSWYYQTCMVSLLLILMYLTTILVGSCNKTKVIFNHLLLTTIRSSLHYTTMQPMSANY